MEKVPKNNTVSVNVCHALFSLLDFLTLESGTDGLSRNVGAELPLYTGWYLRRAQISHDLVKQALVWLIMVWYRVIQFGAVPLSASNANLRQPHIFKHQIYG